jgi:ribose transport system ATP-binding protein
LISSGGVLNLKKEKERAEKYRKELSIKTPSIVQKVRNLSGGNQQKVVIAKWLCRNCDIFIFDEPTVGVDVGAKAEIYKLFEKILADGNSIILISSYLPEVMGLSDRMVVLREGNNTGILQREEYNDEKILKLATVKNVGGI